MKSIKLTLIIIAIVAALALFITFAVQGVRNGAIAYEEQIANAKSDIKVYEKRRADLIPNLVDCVKEYDKHEYETLMSIVNARSMSDDKDIEEIQQMINIVAEAYPELKSSQNYKELMNELATTENIISNYRSSYNSFVRSYNRYVRQFPNSSVLSFLGYEVVQYQYLDFDVSEDAPTNLFG